MEFLFELLFEFILQVFGEALIELGMHAVAEPFRREVDPWLAAVGYLIFGAIFGAITLWLFPSHMVTNAALRWINLALTPVAAGACMAGIGRLRASRGRLRLRIDHCSYGYLFALGAAGVRFVWAA
jgi:hypothetical protein